MSEQVLFTWVHLSDLHFGHGQAAHRWNQQRILGYLKTELGADWSDRPEFPQDPVDALFVTGDVAFSGAVLNPSSAP